MRYTQAYLDDLELALDVPGIDRLRGSSVLVTGATGLIGSAVADLLFHLNARHSYGVEVTLAGRNAGRLSDRFAIWGEGAYAFVPFDAEAPAPMGRAFDYVIHCAGNAHPQAYATRPVETIVGTVWGAKELLDQLVTSGSGRLLFTSSSEVYGKKPEAVPYREDECHYVDILDPRSCYPNSKRLVETMCSAYADEYGVDFVAVRPGHIYGPTMTQSDSRAHAQFARDAAAGRDIVLKSAGNQLRSYCYSTDCATSVLCVLLNGVTCEAYNISNPDAVVTIRQLAEAFADAGGVNVVFETPDDVEVKGYNRMTCSALDSTKIESLGWKGAFDIEKGVSRTLAALK